MTQVTAPMPREGWATGTSSRVTCKSHTSLDDPRLKRQLFEQTLNKYKFSGALPIRCSTECYDEAVLVRSRKWTLKPCGFLNKDQGVLARTNCSATILLHEVTHVSTERPWSSQKRGGPLHTALYNLRSPLSNLQDGWSVSKRWVRHGDLHSDLSKSGHIILRVCIRAAKSSRVLCCEAWHI
eukprot:7059684-Pyramimonas_sp.AAC.4